MAITNFISEIWEARLERFRQKATVFGSIVNRNYEGMITGINQTVTVRTPGFITIKPYTTGGDLALEEPTGTETEVTVDTMEYWGVKMNDVDAVQADVNLLDEYTTDAGYRIALKQDDYVLGLHANTGLAVGSTVSPTDVTNANVLDVLSTINLTMDEADLPEQDRWLVCSPWFVQKIIKAGLAIKSANDSIFMNGVIGSVLGIQLRKSNRVAVVESTKYKFLAGYGNTGITFVNAYVRTKAVDPDLQFYEGVMGLHVYGGKVMRPDTVMTCTFTNGTDV